MRNLVLVLGFVACQPSDSKSDKQDQTPSSDTEGVDTALERVRVVDVGPSSGIDRVKGGLRTRATIIADFDNDGRPDVYTGNPGSDSFIMLNRSTKEKISFVPGPMLHDDGFISWTAAAADYDNDGDIDLYIGGGGNECTSVDAFWHNNLIETGELSFTNRIDLFHQPVLPQLDPNISPTTGVRWADVDGDGNIDLFIGHSRYTRCGGAPAGTNLNTLWHNLGDGTFEDATTKSQLVNIGNTRHPTFLDFDNDGDMDLYENNYIGNSILWGNSISETGAAVFVDRNQLMLKSSGVNLALPERAFASCAADFNNDGFEDLAVFERLVPTDTTVSDNFATNTKTVGLHTIYENDQGRGVKNRSVEANIPIFEASGGGVMGNQVGDLNGDGFIDVFVGNGGPASGAPNQLYFGNGDFTFENRTELISEKSVDSDALIYRTHGSIIADLNGDRVPELLIGNGGPAADPDMDEPNRIFQFEWPTTPDLIEVHLEGDGNNVSRDAIGTAVWLTVKNPDDTTRTLYRSLKGGNCFSAQNGFVLSFGLADSTPVSFGVRWPNGKEEQLSISDANKREFLIRFSEAGGSSLRDWTSGF